jgi:NAD(P)-dependent dehydrogenase (short-subunit alcohol dehydrogenase family)
MPFPYKTVLVTGATAGIGQALAERMIASGIFVIAVGRRQDRLDALVTKHGADKVAGEAFDVSDLEAMGDWAKRFVFTSPSCPIPSQSLLPHPPPGPHPSCSSDERRLTPDGGLPL